MAKILAIAEIVQSKRDRAGNVYNFVCVTNTLTGAKAIGYFSGGVSNIRSALRQYYNSWDSFIDTTAIIPIREFNYRVKDLPYIGCTYEDLIPNILKQWEKYEKEEKNNG